MSEQTAFPLYWPDGRPRTPAGERRVNRSFATTFSRARDNCLLEIKRLGGVEAVVSTNVRLRRDGQAEAVDWSRGLKTDNGAAVFFKRKGKELSFACDRWTHVQDNMHAISLTIQALRGIARWGTGDMMEAAFRGYMALPAPGESGAFDWRKTLGVAINATPEQIRDAYRLLSAKHHPDAGGDVELFHRVQGAWEQYQTIQRT